MKRFKFKETELEYEETTNGCDGCVFKDGVFKDEDCQKLFRQKTIPPCDSMCRSDRKDVIFVQTKNR